MLMIEPASFASIRRAASLRHEKRRAHVERENRIEVFDLDVSQQRRTIHAGIVDENLKRLCRRNRLSRGLDVGDIDNERVGLLASRTDCRSRFFDLGFGTRRERHMRAGLRQCRGCRQPDAAPAAGDQRASAVETKGGSLGEVDIHGDQPGTVILRCPREARGPKDAAEAPGPFEARFARASG
jgi:hypothetical protein